MTMLGEVPEAIEPTEGDWLALWSTDQDGSATVWARVNRANLTEYTPVARVGRQDGEAGAETTWANAQLVAAAPSMREALHQAANTLRLLRAWVGEHEYARTELAATARTVERALDLAEARDGAAEARP